LSESVRTSKKSGIASEVVERGGLNEVKGRSGSRSKMKRINLIMGEPQSGGGEDKKSVCGPKQGKNGSLLSL
jgi:hypothetical protein